MDVSKEISALFENIEDSLGKELRFVVTHEDDHPDLGKLENVKPSEPGFFIALFIRAYQQWARTGIISQFTVQQLRTPETTNPFILSTCQYLLSKSVYDWYSPEVKQYLEKSIALCADYASNFWNLGIYLDTIGKVDEAKKAYSKAQSKIQNVDDVLAPDYAEDLNDPKNYVRERIWCLDINTFLYDNLKKKCE